MTQSEFYNITAQEAFRRSVFPETISQVSAPRLSGRGHFRFL